MTIQRLAGDADRQIGECLWFDSKLFDMAVLDHSAPIVGLHSSGAGGRQWKCIAEASRGAAPVLAPDFLGTPSRGMKGVRAPFHLADEATEILRRLRALPGPSHIVAHSYGAAVAMHITRMYPGLVKSLYLFEPTVFHVLNGAAPDYRECLGRIQALADMIQMALEDDNPLFAAHIFTEFWGGTGAWQALSGTRKEELKRWVWKAPHDFHALINEPVDASEYGFQGIPVTIGVGAQTHEETRCIVEVLGATIRNCRRVEIPGAGHMAPFTHKNQVFQSVKTHIARAEAA